MPYKNREKQKKAVREATKRYRQRKKNRSKIIENLAKKYLGAFCFSCGIADLKQLDIHHLDGDWENESEENLILLCKGCHRVIHWSPISPLYDETRRKTVIEAIEKRIGRKVVFERKGASLTYKIAKAIEREKEQRNAQSI